jgi:hypothetical protein
MVGIGSAMIDDDRSPQRMMTTSIDNNDWPASVVDRSSRVRWIELSQSSHVFYACIGNTILVFTVLASEWYFLILEIQLVSSNISDESLI